MTDRKGVDYIGVSVGAFILNDEGELFLNKRSKNARNEKGFWEAPGGSVNFGEKRIDAIKREVKEEFGIDIEIIRTLQTADEILPKYKQHWIPTTYIAKIKKGQKPKIMEPHKSDAIGWFPLNKVPKPLSYITQLDIQAFKKYPFYSAKTPKVITICSSLSFYREVLQIEKQLKKLGYRVIIPQTAKKMEKNNNFRADYYKTWFKNKTDYKKKTELMNDHFKKVVEGDAILVVNNEKNGIKGYIGGNALMEMALAHYFKKKIFIWNDIASNLPFEEEIRGLNPIFINQDLSKIII